MPYDDRFSPNASMSRRTFVQGLGIVAAMGAAGALLSACSGGQTATQGADGGATQAGGTDEAAAAQEVPAQVGTKTLVAYFSGTGHTQRDAEAIAQALGADVFVITPAQPYATEDLDFNDDPAQAVEWAQSMQA